MNRVENGNIGDPMELLRERGSEGASLHELSQVRGMDSLAIRGYVTTLLESGEPIGLDDSMGCGALLGLSDETRVFLANRPEELEETEDLVAAQIDDLGGLQDVLIETESHLRKRIDAERGS